MPTKLVKKITFCGFGLIGGCMALDFLKGADKVHITAFDKPAVLKRLKKNRNFPVTTEPNLPKAIAGSDIIILAAPHKANEINLKRLSKIRTLTNALIIDTGAVKLPILKLSSQLNFAKETQFLPTHPMAGREKAGFENSALRLFESHCWFIDESIKLSKNNKAKLGWMVKKLRIKPTIIKAAVHDQLMAEISHLPQLISTILGGQVATELVPLAGPGLRSMLRLSGSPYSVWSEIIDQNRPEIIKSLENFRNNLNKVIGMVKSKDSLANIFKASARSYKCL